MGASGTGDGRGVPRVGSCELHPEGVMRWHLGGDGLWIEPRTEVETATPWPVYAAHRED